ncbi:MAG TPA: ClbS/DfsB family four-helix bundle protein [Ktedonobacteraceae bacterium]
MNKTDVLKTIQSAHASLEELLAPLSEAQFCTATFEGQRSLKDILAHIAAWERLCADSIAELVHGELPNLPEEDDDTRNEQIFLENRDRSLHEVQGDFRDAHQELLRQLGVLFQTLPEEDLNDPRRFPWLEGHSLLAFIAGNTYDHYAEHAEQIRAWLQASKVQE